MHFDVHDLSCVLFRMFSDISMSHWNEYIYQAPWSRAGPYVVGIIVGHRLHLTKPKKGVEPYKMHWVWSTHVKGVPLIAK